jgi:hypothetical protein
MCYCHERTYYCTRSRRYGCIDSSENKDAETGEAHDSEVSPTLIASSGTCWVLMLRNQTYRTTLITAIATVEIIGHVVFGSEFFDIFAQSNGIHLANTVLRSCKWTSTHSVTNAGCRVRLSIRKKKSVRDFIASTNPVQRCEGCRALYPRKPHMKLLQAASVRVVLQPGNQLAEEGGGGGGGGRT